MNMIRSFIALFTLLLLCGALTVPLAGCREEGAGERMGRGIDDAAEELEDAAEDVRDRLPPE